MSTLYELPPPILWVTLWARANIIIILQTRKPLTGELKSIFKVLQSSNSGRMTPMFLGTIQSIQSGSVNFLGDRWIERERTSVTLQNVFWNFLFKLKFILLRFFSWALLFIIFNCIIFIDCTYYNLFICCPDGGY